MKARHFFFLLLLFASISLFAQPKIISIDYNGAEATLTRNSPPGGVTYYWQGTSCGELKQNSEVTYLATTNGTFYLRALISTEGTTTWASSCASTIVAFGDLTAPLLSDVTPGPVEPGENISATSSEDGKIYLVPDGTTASASAIAAASIASVSCSAGVAVILSTSGAALGDYVVFAIDGADNVSSSSAVVEVADLTAPLLSDVTPGPVEPSENISATSNEDGKIYLVPDGTTASASAIAAASIASVSCSAGVAVNLSTSGAALGDYVVFAIDGADNVSSSSAVVEVADLTAPLLSDVTPGPVEPSENISATSSEDGMIYLVPDGTTASASAIAAAGIASVSCSAGVAVNLSTSGAALGDYVVFAIDGADNVSSSSAVVEVADLTAPLLSDVTPGPVKRGDDISATSDEEGMIYLVPEGTTASASDIANASIASVSCSANVAISLSTSGAALGNYVVFAIDASENISAASAAITIDPGTGLDLNKVTDDVHIYPFNVVDVLHIRSKTEISSIAVYTLNGSQVMMINNHREKVDMSSLKNGLYLISIRLRNNEIFTGKINKL